MKQGGHRANSAARTPYHWPIPLRGLAMLLIGVGAGFGNVGNAVADGNVWICNSLDNTPLSNNAICIFSSNPAAKDYFLAPRDAQWVSPAPSIAPTIYSLLGSTKMYRDERTNNPTNLPLKINIAFNGFNPSEATNNLYFSFPGTNTFDGKTITLQECDSNDAPFGPAYDIRDTIANSNGLLNIGTLAAGTYNVNVPYKHFLLWITNGPVQTYSVSISPGVFSASPTNFSGIPSGGSVTTTVESIYVTNAPGVREKFVGFQKVE